MTDRDLGYTTLLEQLSSMRSIELLVGVRGGDEVPVDEHGRPTPTLAEIAAANEFGTERIPERSFLRATVDGNRTKYVKVLQDASAKGNTVAALQTIERLGLQVVADVQRAIRNRVPPPNAPETIERKGSDVPLIDTGRLRQSIDYTVEVSGERIQPVLEGT